jgi:16S rRNA (cytosine967-C5)-methyltransferase
MAQMMENRGTVLAFDLHEHRAKLIDDGAKRLGLTCISARTGDASQFSLDLPKADRILCDVPCSGFGVIRRKPEIRYKPLTDFQELPELQYRILENAARYLKKGGTLVYSTCTVLQAENEAVVERFLAAHPEFELVPLTEFGFSQGYAVFSVLYDNCDGFFAARLRRKEGEDGTA